MEMEMDNINLYLANKYRVILPSNISGMPQGLIA